MTLSESAACAGASRALGMPRAALGDAPANHVAQVGQGKAMGYKGGCRLRKGPTEGTTDYKGDHGLQRGPWATKGTISNQGDHGLLRGY